MRALWMAAATVGLEPDPATLDEVKQAIRLQGLDDSKVQVEDKETGLFLIPLTDEQEKHLIEHRWLMFVVQPESGGEVTFTIDAGEAQ
jgi:hypothetical protein